MIGAQDPGPVPGPWTILRRRFRNGPTRRGAVGAMVLSQLLLAGSLKLLVLQPEQCPAPSEVALEGAIDAAVEWFSANVEPDGRFLYRYRPESDTIEPGYNIVRHAGSLVALEQAAAAGWDAALTPAEAGWRFVENHLVDVPGPGSAFVVGAEGADTDADTDADADAGAAALSAVAWTMRLERNARFRSGALEPPPALIALGTFLVGQVEPTGAVAAFRDRVSGQPLPIRSRFYTGEVAWALQRLAALVPDHGFEEPAARTLRYLVQDRDRVERWFPPIADHWAAYALAEAATRADRSTSAAPTSEVPTNAGAFRTAIAGRFAIQVRWESQRRVGSTFSALTRGRPAVGAALGTLGEGLGQLAMAELAHLDPPAGDGNGNGGGDRDRDGDRDIDAGPGIEGLRRQMGCVTGLLVARQVSEDEAGRWPQPDRAAGAWVTGGVTQVDDQQHALSALLVERALRRGWPETASDRP
ncbi:MAG: hypothetical protein ACKV2O_13175 [Acidimicrobiales bacterium]